MQLISIANPRKCVRSLVADKSGIFIRMEMMTTKRTWVEDSKLASFMPRKTLDPAAAAAANLA